MIHHYHKKKNQKNIKTYKKKKRREREEKDRKKLLSLTTLPCYHPFLSLATKKKKKKRKESYHLSSLSTLFLPPHSPTPSQGFEKSTATHHPAGLQPDIAEAPSSAELERRRKVGSWRGRGDGRRDLVHGGEIRLLPAEPAVVQAGAGRRAGPPHPELLPAPGERGGAQAADPAGDGDRRGVRPEPDGDVDASVLARERGGCWADV